MQKIWSLILVGFVIVLVGVSAFLYGQNQGLGKNGAATTENSEESAQVNNVSPSNSAVTPTISQTTENTPVVVIESEGAYPAQDVAEIRTRVIAPYLDYKNEVQPGDLVSFKISQNQQASKPTYPYLADAVFKNGGNEGFVIGRTDGHISWYIPECLNGCQFSEAFKAKYPEIVKLAQ